MSDPYPGQVIRPASPQTSNPGAYPGEVITPAYAAKSGDPVIAQYVKEATDALNAKASKPEMDAIAKKYGYEPYDQGQYDVAHAAVLAGRPAVVGRDSSTDIVTPTEKPPSFLEGVGQGVDKVINNGVHLLYQIPGAQAFDEFMSRHLGMAPTQADAERQQKEHYAQALYSPSPAGKFVGEMAATAPTNYLPGGPIVQGAAQGGLVTDETTPGGVAKDMAIGAVAGQAGANFARNSGQLIAPAVNAVSPNVRLLLNEGVRSLTPGQVSRGERGFWPRLITGTEDRATGQAVVGDMITADRRNVIDEFNRAVTNRALRPIGEALPDGIAPGHDAVRYAGDRLSAGYQDLLPRMSGNVDQAFAQRIGAIRQRLTANPAFPDDASARLQQAQLELSRAFRPDGTFNGRALAQTRDQLDKLSSAWSRSDDPYVREVGQATGDMRAQLLALVRRQNPADAERLRGLERGWASLVQQEKAAAQTADGIISPNQYSTSIRQANDSVRKRAVARGTALNQDLSTAAREVIPSRVGDSGTAGRAGQTSLTSWGIGAAQAAPYLLARGVNAAAKRAPVQSPTANYVGDLLRQGAPTAGRLAATAVPSIASQAVHN